MLAKFQYPVRTLVFVASIHYSMSTFPVYNIPDFYLWNPAIMR